MLHHISSSDSPQNTNSPRTPKASSKLSTLLISWRLFPLLGHCVWQPSCGSREQPGTYLFLDAFLSFRQDPCFSFVSPTSGSAVVFLSTSECVTFTMNIFLPFLQFFFSCHKNFCHLCSDCELRMIPTVVEQYKNACDCNEKESHIFGIKFK